MSFPNSEAKIEKAKEQLLNCVAEKQKLITKIKPAIQEKKIRYEELIKAFSLIRGANLFFPYIGSGIGNGSFVELLDGSIKYDMISGIGVHYFGHSHLKLIETAIDASLSDILVQGNLQQNLDSLEFSELLVNASGLPHIFLTSSGVMANENALKLAFQKNAPADRVLAFERSFGGRSLTFSQISDKPLFREGLPVHLPVDYVPFFDPKKPEESKIEAVNALKKHIYRYPKSYAAMIMELVQGEGGFYPGSTDFFKALMEILKEQGIAIFVDEIQTFGRTSELFAYQHFGLEEFVDIVSIGKLSLCCATLFTEGYKPRPGLLSQTFTSSTAAIRAGHLVIKTLLEGDFFGEKGRIMEIQNRFQVHLKIIEERYPGLIEGPFGIGSMVAFTAFKGSYEKNLQFVKDLFEAGVITFIAGRNPTRVRMLPPAGVIQNEEIDDVMRIVENVLLQI